MKKRITYLLLLFVILSVVVASLPLSLLHHHSHDNVCQVNSNLPDELKRDKDTSPVHLHLPSESCFLCFQSHPFFSYEGKELQGVVFTYREIQSVSLVASTPFRTINFYAGRAPPVRFV